MRFFIYSKLLKESDRQYVIDLLEVMNQHSIEYAFYGKYAEQIKDQKIIESGVDIVNTYGELCAYKPDLVMTMGGDGTILSAIDLVRDSDVPIMGVNLGRLGFLSSIEKSKIKEVVEAVVAGEYYTEPRSMLELTCNLPLFDNLPFAFKRLYSS